MAIDATKGHHRQDWRQRDPPGWGWDRQAVASSLVGRVPCYLARACSAPTRNTEVGIRILERESTIPPGQTPCADLRGCRPIGIGIDLPPLMTVSSPLWLCT